MIEREWVEQDINKAFFPVQLCNLECHIPEQTLFGFDGKDKLVPVKGYYAVVDMERSSVLSVVTNKYRLVTNKEAYEWGAPVVGSVFNQSRFEDFRCYNIRMTSKRSSCDIDLVRKNGDGVRTFNPFGDDDSWTAFIRISNSYNKTMCLRYELGFCRCICMNGVIFSKKSVNLKIPHIKDKLNEEKLIQRLHIEAEKNIGVIQDIEQEFVKKLNRLKSCELPRSVMLAIVCKVFGYKMTRDKKQKLEGRALEKVKGFVELIDARTSEYFDNMGNNAYAALNVLTDYASFPEVVIGGYLVNNFQAKVGDWIDDYIAACDRPDFNMIDYLGKESMESATWYGSLRVA